MRWFLLSIALLIGCGSDPSESPNSLAVADADEPPLGNRQAERPSSPDDSSKDRSTPPKGDLWTRKAGVDWTRFLGPTNDSKSPETGILTDWPAEGPKIVWQLDPGTGYGAPTIWQGRLYLFARFNDRPKDRRLVGDARLTCLNAETGQELWRFEYPTDYEDYFNYNNGPRCCPVVDDGRVYIHGVEGMLHCLDAVSGELIWKVDTFADFNVVQNFFGVGSTPLIEGDLLICVIGGAAADTPDDIGIYLDRVKPAGSGVVAFEKKTGKVKYKLGDELAGYASPVCATIDGKRWCFAFCRGGLLAFDPASGEEQFHFPWRAKTLECVNASNPVIVDEKVLISECYGVGGALLAIEPGGCDVLWSDDDKPAREQSLLTHWNTAVHHEGYVYASSGRHTPDAELRCVELESGEVQWSVPELSRSSLLLVDGHFVCLTEYGELILFKANPKEFEQVARVYPRRSGGKPIPGFGAPPLLRYPCWAAPVLSHGLLYLRGDDRLVCMELIEEKKE